MFTIQTCVNKYHAYHIILMLKKMSCSFIGQHRKRQSNYNTQVNQGISRLTISAIKMAVFSTALSIGLGQKILETILKFMQCREMSKLSFI